MIAHPDECSSAQMSKSCLFISLHSQPFNAYQAVAKKIHAPKYSSTQLIVSSKINSA